MLFLCLATIGYYYQVIGQWCCVEKSINSSSVENVKKNLPLNELQCARCLMLILQVKVVVGGEDYCKANTKELRSPTLAVKKKHICMSHFAYAERRNCTFLTLSPSKKNRHTLLSLANLS